MNIYLDKSNNILHAKEHVVDLVQISLRPISLYDLDDLLLWTSDEKVFALGNLIQKGIGFIQNIASKSLWFRTICLRDRAIGVLIFGRIQIDAGTNLLNLAMLYAPCIGGKELPH